MRAKIIIVSPPRFNLFPGICKCQKPVRVQTFIAKRAIERLDERVVRWLARARVVERDAVLVSVAVQCHRDKFRAVVDLYATRLVATLPQAFQRGHHVLAAQTGSNVDSQAFAGEVVDDRQCAKAATVKQCIGNKVHAP